MPWQYQVTMASVRDRLAMLQVHVMHKRSSSSATVLLALLALLANHSTQAAAARASKSPLQSLWTQTRALLQDGDDADSPSKTPAKDDSGSSGADSVTVVKTARALQDAVQKGEAHIEIQQHLDLTGLKPITRGLLLGVVPETVRSIRVCCLLISFPRKAIRSAMSRMCPQHSCVCEDLPAVIQLEMG